MATEYWTEEDRKMITEGPPEDQVQPETAGKIPEKRSIPETADEQEEDGLFNKGRP